MNLRSRFEKLAAPVRIHVLFRERKYRLGETVEMAVEIVTRDRLRIREARATLVCEPQGQPTRDLRFAPEDGPWTGQSYAHSQLAFSEDETLRAGGAQSYSVDLQIENKPPAGGFEDARWRVVLVVETVDHRTYYVQRGIRLIPTWKEEADLRR